MNTSKASDTESRRCWARFSTAVSSALLMLLSSSLGQAQTYWVTHTFGAMEGAEPLTLLASGGNLYGTTYKGALPNLGALFVMNADGSNYRLLKSFTGNGQGANPSGDLVLDGTTLYGVTYGDSSTNFGTLYKVDTDGTGYTVLKSFTDDGDGAGPGGGMLLAGSTLYGLRQQYNSSAGAVFRINTDGSGYQALASFNGTGATNPCAALVLCGTELFGVTSTGGTNHYGTIFKLGTNGGGFTILRHFAGTPTDGSTPTLPLAVVGSTLYGVTGGGGSNDNGTIFRINPDGSGYTLLKSFGFGAEGEHPSCKLVSNGPMLYGSTSSGGATGNGTLFMVNTDGSNYTVLKDFTANDSYQGAYGLVVLGSALYGVALQTATAPNGTVFGLALPTVAPVIACYSSDRSVAEGTPVLLSVYASGSPTLGYQWFFNETNFLAGPNTNVVQLPAAQLSQSGLYTVVVTNSSGAVTSAPAGLTVIASGTVPVTSLTEAGLRAALAGSSPITFAADGLLTLSSPVRITHDTMLDGSGHQVVLSGGGLASVFYVETNVTLTVRNLNVANGAATNGGALWNHGGRVNLALVKFQGNSARDLGGAIFNQGGRIIASNCTFAGNIVGAANLSVTGLGGALENEGAAAVVNLSGCVFAGNAAGLGGSDASGTPRCGGALFNGGLLSAESCTFLQNTAGGVLKADGYGGNPGGQACGGVIANAGAVLLASCLFASNSATGGRGSVGTPGQPSPYYSVPGGRGGRGGDGSGSGIYNEGTASIVNCTFAWNQSAGGPGGQGGDGGLAYISGYGWVQGIGGNGGDGGNGLGDVYSTSGQLSLINCTLALGSSSGGAGAMPGFGVGPYTPLPGTNGIGTGVLNTRGGSTLNSLLAGGVPRNFDGTITDLGHNLSSDASCAFTNHGSLNSTAPGLGPLAYNGGTTLTLALLPGSPALDAGANAGVPSTDQRGFPRPAGPAADIGAYEYCLPSVLRLDSVTADGADIHAYGQSGQTWRLLSSVDLQNWNPVATNQLNPDGTWVFHDNGSAPLPRFYRLAQP